MSETLDFSGDPREIRTPGLLIRSQALYPAELWSHYMPLSTY